MNNPEPEIPADDEVASPAQQSPVQQFDPRRRLRELLSVPERDRSDEQWDEIIELEIQLAPGNRAPAGDSLGGNPGRVQTQHGKPGGGQPKKHRPRSNNNRRGRPNKPPTGGGSAA